MILTRLFSRTWTNLKTKEERSKKKGELLEARKVINKRRDQIKAERTEGLKGSALGTNTKFVVDKAGKRLKDKDGNFWTTPVTAKEVDSKFKAQMEDLNAYSSSISDKKIKPAPSAEKGIIEKAKEGATKILKNPATKKWGYRTAGATAGTLAVSGAGYGIKKMKDKKKEKEAKEQILNGKKK